MNEGGVRAVPMIRGLSDLSGTHQDWIKRRRLRATVEGMPYGRT